eukprot:CAMPEP_0174266698 /NCGR_PEP_ID=MMETSP0439-20130205/31134_1 /TAXON_ID=0 /ORGANISM="Stereomyxa ramosa, Strain Chinc5" /LENGTH=1025 /DNA_ID=CAMNT_0015353817 /DNA_START=70 /DNA_END=3147 /DNA_ORIENTATION=-
MSVYYKFKSMHDFSSVAFEGSFITLGELKRAIVSQKKLDKGTDFDLKITNAQTQEDYKEDSFLVPKNTSVIVCRVPSNTNQQPTIIGQTLQISSNEVQKAQSTNEESFDEFGAPVFSSVDGTKTEEDEKIEELISGASGWAPEQTATPRYPQYGKMDARPPPPAYICHRCNEPGHYIHMCPTNGDERYNFHKLKKPTGIPTSFLKPVEAGDKRATLIMPGGGFATATPIETAFKKVADLSDVEIPRELQCTMCQQLLREAVLIPCCGNSFCDECIRTALLDGNMECPMCKQRQSPDNLFPNKKLREGVDSFTRNLVTKAQEKVPPVPVKVATTTTEPPVVPTKTPPVNPLVKPLIKEWEPTDSTSVVPKAEPKPLSPKTEKPLPEPIKPEEKKREFVPPSALPKSLLPTTSPFYQQALQKPYYGETGQYFVPNSERTCFHCGSTGHVQANCPYNYMGAVDPAILRYFYGNLASFLDTSGHPLEKREFLLRQKKLRQEYELRKRNRRLREQRRADGYRTRGAYDLERARAAERRPWGGSRRRRSQERRHSSQERRRRTQSPALRRKPRRSKEERRRSKRDLHDKSKKTTGSEGFGDEAEVQSGSKSDSGSSKQSRRSPSEEENLGGLSESRDTELERIYSKALNLSGVNDFNDLEAQGGQPSEERDEDEEDESREESNGGKEEGDDEIQEEEELKGEELEDAEEPEADFDSIYSMDSINSDEESEPLVSKKRKHRKSLEDSDRKSKKRRKSKHQGSDLEEPTKKTKAKSRKRKRHHSGSSRSLKRQRRKGDDSEQLEFENMNGHGSPSPLTGSYLEGKSLRTKKEKADEECDEGEVRLKRHKTSRKKKDKHRKHRDKRGKLHSSRHKKEKHKKSGSQLYFDDNVEETESRNSTRGVRLLKAKKERRGKDTGDTDSLRLQNVTDDTRASSPSVRKRSKNRENKVAENIRRSLRDAAVQAQQSPKTGLRRSSHLSVHDRLSRPKTSDRGSHRKSKRDRKKRKSRREPSTASISRVLPDDSDTQFLITL